MTTKPVTIESVPQASKTFRFVAYTDPVLMTGYELVEEVTLDANGVATLIATPPVGKSLCGCFHTVIGGVAHTRFRILTDNF